MNIMLEDELNKQLKNCYFSMSDIIHNMNSAYSSEDIVKTAVWENDLATLIKNIKNIEKLKKIIH